MKSATTDTTRYLCAAAHLDGAFRRQVFKKIIEEEHKYFGVSFGVDLIPVIKHCLAAKHRNIILEILLSGLLLSALFFAPIFGFWISFLTFLGIALLVRFSELWISHHHIVAKSLAKGKYNLDSVKFNTNGYIEKILEEIRCEQIGNVVIYGGFSPFVGAGFDIGGWSFALNTDKGKEHLGTILEPLPFQISELYEHLVNRLEEIRLNGLSIEDKLYVDGEEIRDDKRFLANPFVRPVTNIEYSQLKPFIENPTQAIRHYKCIRVAGWKGELILSIFIRFTKVGDSLFAESSYFLLPPLKRNFYKIDNYQRLITWRKVINLILEAGFTTPLLWLFSPLLVLLRLFAPFMRSWRRRRNRRIIKENPTFNYGATTSIREFATSAEYQRYFQKLDKEMNVKIIERQILDSIIDFLDHKNIDTSDLKKREIAILNNGVIVTGGDIRAHNLSVGSHAKSMMSYFTRPTQSTANANTD